MTTEQLTRENTKADTALKQRQNLEAERTGKLDRERFAWERQISKQTHEATMKRWDAEIAQMRADVERIRADGEYIRRRTFWAPILAVATVAGTTVLIVIAGIRFINWGFGG